MRFLPLTIVIALFVVLAMAAPGCADRACFEWTKPEGPCPSEKDAATFFGSCTDIVRVASPPEFLDDGLCCYHVVKTANDSPPIGPKCSGGIGGGPTHGQVAHAHAVTSAGEGPSAGNGGASFTGNGGSSFGGGFTDTGMSSAGGQGGFGGTGGSGGSGLGGSSMTGTGGSGGSSCTTCAAALTDGTENVCGGKATSVLSQLLSCACSSACDADCTDFCTLGDAPDTTCTGCLSASCGTALAHCQAH